MFVDFNALIQVLSIFELSDVVQYGTVVRNRQ